MHAFTQPLAVVFPGQAAQRKGLGRALFARHRPALRLAEEALGYSLAEAAECEWLEHTAYVQPVLFAANALAWREWADAHGAAPAFALGHGLGECNALHAAGAFDFQTGLSLAAERGRLMAGRRRADGGGDRLGRAAAARRTDGDRRRRRRRRGDRHRRLRRRRGRPSPAARRRWRGPRRGCARAQVIPLRASGAFHSRHMRAAAAQFARALAAVEFAPLAFAVVSTWRPRRTRCGREAQVLAAQIAAAVRWADSLDYLLDAGVDRFEEPGPAPVLIGSIEQFRAARPASRARGEARLDSAVPPLPFAAAAAAAAVAGGGAGVAGIGHGRRAGFAAVARAARGRRRSARACGQRDAAMREGFASGHGAARMAWTGGSTGTFGFRDAGGVAMAQLEQELVAMRAALPSGQAWGALCRPVSHASATRTQRRPMPRPRSPRSTRARAATASTGACWPRRWPRRCAVAPAGRCACSNSATVTAKASSARCRRSMPPAMGWSSSTPTRRRSAPRWSPRASAPAGRTCAASCSIRAASSPTPPRCAGASI
ncbi:acyltransferase domain-containing protein [Lysobacter enzymogenes]|nr:acyltransferase domain-containing protein [Lysobacter enzymogenes]